MQEVKLKFKKQEFQEKAVNSICSIFSGQDAANSLFTITTNNILDTDEQRLTVSHARMLKNLQAVQKKNHLPQNDSLDVYEYTDENGNTVDTKIPNFTVEMETGTGKTFVYTKTILELNRLYGWKKFVIVVPPNTAILEGVVESMNATREWFLGEGGYAGTSYQFEAYSGDKANSLRSFAHSDDIRILVITKSAFDKASNIITKGKTKEDYKAPIEFIQEVRPIVIIDEPQSVDTTNDGKKVIAEKLKPLFILRYSATHKFVYNLAYKLGPVEAHREGIVKEITVSSIRANKDFNKPYIRVVEVEHSGGYRCKLELDIRNKKGFIERKTTGWLNKTAELYEPSGEREFYRDWKITNIVATPGMESVQFETENIPLGGAIGDSDETALKKAQIMRTIQLHFETEKRLTEKGVKVLSLFFIDEVAKYRASDEEKGEYAQMFEECYEELRQKYPELTMGDAEFAHEGYFSKDGKHFKDTKGNTKTDDSTYDRIIKNKGKLLSLDNPIRFIFSHSALKEGWDNPNVFQICTLLEPRTEFTRRQKIGRGLRLCVNQEGERVLDNGVNMLYVISDENFAEFAKGLQKNYEDDLGITFDGITVNYLEAITTPTTIIQTKMDLPLIEKTIELNKIRGAIDDDGNIVKPEKLDVPKEIATSKEQVINAIRELPKVEQISLESLEMEIEKIEEKPLELDVRNEVVETFKAQGYLDKKGKPTDSMKTDFARGEAAIKLPERAENARTEIYEFFAKKFETPSVSNADDTDIAMVNKDVLFGSKKAAFDKLWAKISPKMRYHIEMTDDELKSAVKTRLAGHNWSYVSKITISYEDGAIKNKDTGIEAVGGSSSVMAELQLKHRIPDILRIVSEQCNIPKRLVWEILDESGKFEEFLNNPQVFMEQFITAINKEKHKLEIAQISYIPTGSNFTAAEVFDKFRSFEVNTKNNAVAVENSLFNFIKYDSEKVELKFAEKIDGDENVELFLKLPTKKYVISTPVGDYTPDWAIIKKTVYGKHSEIYFVVETKGSLDDEELRLRENAKIKCAREHFRALGYEVEDNMPLGDHDSKYTKKTDYKEFSLEA